MVERDAGMQIVAKRFLPEIMLQIQSERAQLVFLSRRRCFGHGVGQDLAEAPISRERGYLLFSMIRNEGSGIEIAGKSEILYLCLLYSGTTKPMPNDEFIPDDDDDDDNDDNDDC